MAAESEEQRSQRRHSRTLFDGVADLYRQTRPGYPDGVVRFIAGTAGLPAGASVLEVGCGTGQFTEVLVRAGFAVTAVDLGASMVAAARARVGDRPVSFRVGTFEEFTAPDGSFDLVVSAAAFHWLDPDVKYAKAAALLRAGGWLAVLDGDENYDEPFGTALHELWEARSPDEGAWVRQQRGIPDFDGTSLFTTPVRFTETETLSRSVDGVVGVESTRAISLVWPDEVRAGFADGIRSALAGVAMVPLTRDITVTMAQVRHP